MKEEVAVKDLSVDNEREKKLGDAIFQKGKKRRTNDVRV